MHVRRSQKAVAIGSSQEACPIDQSERREEAKIRTAEELGSEHDYGGEGKGGDTSAQEQSVVIHAEITFKWILLVVKGISQRASSQRLCR